MGAACGDGSDKRFKRIEELRKNFPEYHKEEEKGKKYKYDQKDTEELIEYWKRFTAKKEELSKSNPKLFYVLFNRNDQESKKFTYEGLKTDDEEKFYFFFNKRRFEELNLSESIIVFPRFSFQKFPYYKDENSLLTTINITSSTILFDGLMQWYLRLDRLQNLNLSYNNITSIPETFSCFKELKELNLRRNKLTSLPKSFETMNNLTNVDLSENNFTACPKELFVKSGEDQSKIQKLNMSSNQLKLFEIPGLDENTSLKFLFMSNNLIQKVPNDIRKLKGLLFVNLDDNLIKDCDNMEEMPEKVKISMNSAVNPDLKWEQEEKKDKPIPKNLATPKATFNPRVSTVNFTTRNESKGINYSFPGNKDSGVLKSAKTGVNQQNDNDELNQFLIDDKNKDKMTDLERELADYMKDRVKKEREDVKHDSVEKVKTLEKKRFFKMVEQLNAAINNSKENEIANIDNIELKILYKKAYATILRKKKLEVTGKLEPDLDQLDPLEQEYFKKFVLVDPNKKNDQNNEEEEEDESQKKKTKGKKKEDQNEKYKKRLEELSKNCVTAQKEDISNLEFMKQINKEMTSHKIRFYLQYIRNIDNQLYEDLLNIWETQERSSFIVTLTEIKIFLNEMLSKFELDPLQEEFKIEKTEDKNVVHEIFYNQLTRNFLRQLGMSKIEKSKAKGVQQDIFHFDIKKSDQEINEENQKKPFYEKKAKSDEKAAESSTTTTSTGVKAKQFYCNMQQKYYLVDEFLENFIQIIRTSKFDPIDLEGP